MRNGPPVNSAQLSGDNAAVWNNLVSIKCSAQFSMDGKRVVTASINMAQVWDVASGKPIGEPMKGGSIILSAQFSPDGQAGGDRLSRIRRHGCGMQPAAKPIGEPMKHEKNVCSAQFSPDGQRVVTASWDKTARLWDAATGKPIGEPMKHEGRSFSAV